MKLQEAQELSMTGVAVRGNPVMQDILWPKGSPHPFVFIVNGWKPKPDTNWADKDDWTPLHQAYKKPENDL